MVLTDIANQVGKIEIIPMIKKAVSDVKATGYEKLIAVKKLSKRSPKKDYQAITYRHLTPKGELHFIEITDKDDEKERYIISDGYVKFPLENYAYKCEWAEKRFIIKDRQDHVRAYVDADLKTMYSMQKNNC